jgi:hypothetical protein
MSNKNTLPIGKLLQNADLISSEQLEKALKIQAQSTKMRLGEILSQQEVVKTETVNFFVDIWQEISQEGEHFPLGYYLKKACLLNDQQVQAILAEQKNTKLKFGDLAVQKGWLKSGTIDFFLNTLSFKIPQLISLIALEEYNHRSLHLERKYTNSSLILSRILAWTGGEPTLTKTISDTFANSDFNIPAGMEVSAVDQLVEVSLIRNWQTTQAGSYIRFIKKSLIENQKCEPSLLLAEYQDVLLSNNQKYQQTKEQNELLRLGLVVENEKQLRITNLIYQQIFNQNWLIKARNIIEAKKDNKTNVIITKKTNSIAIQPKNSSDNLAQKDLDHHKNKEISVKKTEPLTKFSSLLTLIGVILFIPLVLAINNYYSSKQDLQTNSRLLSEAGELEQFCNQINSTDPVSSISLITQIETNKQVLLRSFPNTLEVFPDNCEIALNKLRVLAAPQLGKENRVIEAIRHLCKIPADAENINEAKIWVEHWYTSLSWGEETKFYLSLTNDCPAGKR